MAKSDKSTDAAIESPSKFPEGAASESAPVVRTLAPLDDAYAGLFKRVKFPGGADGDGSLFMLAINADEPSGKTHFLKNKSQFVNVTPADFRAQFDKQ